MLRLNSAPVWRWVLSPILGRIRVSYLQSLQEPERPKPATTRNQTESGIVQHFPIIIPRKRGGAISKQRCLRNGAGERVGEDEWTHLGWVHTYQKLPRATRAIHRQASLFQGGRWAGLLHEGEEMWTITLDKAIRAFCKQYIKDKSDGPSKILACPAFASQVRFLCWMKIGCPHKLKKYSLLVVLF